MNKKMMIFAFLLAFSHNVLAKCSFNIDSNDAMQFSAQTLTVPSDCKKVTLTLNHTGKLPAKVMGHNWVLAKTPDVKAIAMEGMSAGLANKYIKEGDDRVFAASDIIGGGESTTLEFSTDKLKAGGDYTFFCSFPGHFGIMKGKFEFV
ncbi:azurin [Pseudoalteromonas aurantia]|uniref:Azurin n=1 Tax=Pseudoalteromonas aurantia TaxID=43654 RepID=A0ABY2VS87_9GAMM|nr:azurin [Pseudoalteromonas aurantia]TMO69604.1 azurin [Pseudoalteromonas aurantia]